MHCWSIQTPLHTNEDLCPRDTLRRGEFYNDWLHQHDIAETIGACILTSGSTITNLTIMRPERQGLYEKADLELIEQLMPHMQCAIMLHKRLSDEQQREALATAALEGLTQAIIGVDASGRVRYTNAGADAMLRARDGLEVHGSRLIASVSAESSQLRSLIANASSILTASDRAHPGLMCVTRPSARRPLVLLVAPPPIEDQGDGGVSELAAVIFVTDPETSLGPSDAFLRQCYGLTPAECDVAVSIGQSHSIDETARSLKISPQTVRVHLKRVFRKTGTASQQDLIALLVSGPVQLQGTGPRPRA